MSHILHVLFGPLFSAGVFIVLFYLLAKRAPRVAVLLPALAFALVMVLSVPAVGNALLRSLEQPPHTTMKPDVVYDAVIVLGGGINPTLTAETGMTAFNSSGERVLAGYDLLRKNVAKNAILSGGPWTRAKRNPAAAEPEARVTADQLEAWGIDRSRLALDEHALNTHENAVESARIARAHGWTRNLLVTSASHMPRAEACFAHEGLPFDTLSVDFESYDPERSPSSWIPGPGGLSMSARAIHERVGMLVYRLRGWVG